MVRQPTNESNPMRHDHRSCQLFETPVPKCQGDDPKAAELLESGNRCLVLYTFRNNNNRHSHKMSCLCCFTLLQFHIFFTIRAGILPVLLPRAPLSLHGPQLLSTARAILILLIVSSCVSLSFSFSSSSCDERSESESEARAKVKRKRVRREKR